MGGLWGLVLLAAASVPPPLPFGPGEDVRFRITYAHLTAGRAALRVEAGDKGGRKVLRFVAEARSEGFLSWLLRYQVEDRTVATWDPDAGCSLGIEKRLREGRAARDQTVAFESRSGTAQVEDSKIHETRFEVGPCILDVLSAFFVTRTRGVEGGDGLSLPVFDNGRRYLLGVRLRGRERLDLPPPLGKDVPTVVVEPLLLEGTGLFVKSGRLFIWLTDDARHIPVRLRSRVAIGSVSADLETYTPPLDRRP
jgi:hypothetical protein